MKFHNEDDDVESEDLLNLTSMIDVVFTLLAFFIITVRMFGSERDAVIGPARESGTAGLVQGDLPQQITIRLLHAPSETASPLRILIGGHEYADAAAITGQLREINLPEVEVVFAAAPELPVEHVASAVDAALNSPMKRVSLRQVETTESPAGPSAAPGAGGASMSGSGGTP